MEYRVLLRQKVKVYGDEFHVELHEFPKWDGGSWFQLVNVYANCEHDRGIPYHTIEEAVGAFESATGRTLTEEVKSYLWKR